MTRCAEVRQYLSDYLEGALSPEQAQQVERHLQTCLECARERRVLEQVPALMRQWSPPVPSEPIWAGIEARLRAGGEGRAVSGGGEARRLTPQRLTRWLPAATLTAAAVAALVVFFFWRSQPAYPPLSSSYANYWQAHREWAISGGTGELYPYVEAR